MAKSNSASPTITARLKVQYNDKLRAELKERLKLDNLNEVPKLQKVIVSVGLGRAKDDKRAMEAAATTLAKITGQKPVATISKKSIASFKLRDGQVIGMKVTLRRDKMYEFADKLINVVLPRLRDFHGVNHKSFDGRGNYTIGFEDQTIWPELSFEDTSTPHGLEVTFVTSTESDGHAKSLLESFGMPFVKEGSK
jgi:large subunit ribosomal protein L5